MLVIDFEVEHRLKNIQRYFCGMHRMHLMRMHRRKKGHFLYIRGRAILIATGTKLLDTKYTFYEFDADLIETIN